MPLDPDSDTLPLPRILCLHGGGVNAKVFRLQCRSIIAHLRSHFRLVFVDAPFPSAAHEAIAPVFGDLGPFCRWLRFLDDHPDIEAPVAAARILGQCRAAVEADPGTGEWVGLLGFSQGAKITASLLWAQEHITKTRPSSPSSPPLPPTLLPSGVTFRFGVIMNGSPPVVMLDPTGELPLPRHAADAAHPSMSFEHWPDTNGGEHVISIPTLHVHGLKDPKIDMHRKLMYLYCKDGTTKLVEWDGNHRLPIKTADVEMVTSKILELARETGVF